MPLTDIQKTTASIALDMAFDTFKRPAGQKIVVYRYPEKTLVQSKPTYNFGYPEDANTEASFTNTPVSGEIDATIEYLSKEQYQKLDFAQVNARFVAGKGIVQISVRPSGMQIIVDAERIEFDNKTFFVITEAMPRGLFVPNYYDFWLQSTD